MKASVFISEIKSVHGLTITPNGNRLQVTGVQKLPRYLRLTIAGHRHQLLAWLTTGVDAELEQRSADLDALGFVRILASEEFDGDHLIQRFVWCHPEGDSVGDAILVGLLDSKDAIADAKARDLRSRTMEWAARFPAIGRILGR